MDQLTRISFSLESSLLEKWEQLRQEKGYKNRSEFFRDMVRSLLVERACQRDEEVVGAITLLYDHDTPGLANALTAQQHEHHAAILATTHVHLDHHHCVEVILVRARASQVQALAFQLQKQRGVLHGGLVMTATGSGLA
jgi:CopG family nickel-responsive transcriptional regulator